MNTSNFILVKMVHRSVCPLIHDSASSRLFRAGFAWQRCSIHVAHCWKHARFAILFKRSFGDCLVGVSDCDCERNSNSPHGDAVTSKTISLNSWSKHQISDAATIAPNSNRIDKRMRNPGEQNEYVDGLRKMDMSTCCFCSCFR